MTRAALAIRTGVDIPRVAASDFARGTEEEVVRESHGAGQRHALVFS